MMPDKGHEEADKELKRLEKELTKHYAQAAKELTKKAEAFMRDFERKDNQMQTLVDAGKMTKDDYLNWRRNQMMTEERIQEMRDTLAKDLTNADQIAAGMINDTLPNAYAENFNFGTYEIETGTTIDTSFTLYDKKTVENLMKKDPKIIPQARVDIPKDERWNRKKLTSAIAQGILQGESIPKIATRLQNVAAMDRNAAIRNARTYTTAAENKGRVDSIERANEMGIPADQEWIATLDDRTRMEHRHLDGQVRPVGEPFSADGYRIMYPGDPDAEPEMIYNCRCTLVSKVRGRIYNDERNESKLGGMSYEEWKHAKDRQIKPQKQEEEITRETASNEWFEYEKANLMREYIREGEMPSMDMNGNKVTEEEAERLKKEAELIQKEAAETKTEYKTLYRGMVMDEDEARETFTPGQTYTFDTLTATTTDKEIAKIYSDVENYGGGEGVPVIFEIQKPDGIYGFDRDGSEIVMPKGGEFKVTRNYMDDDGVIHISLYSPKGNNVQEETKKEEKLRTENQKEYEYVKKFIENNNLTYREVGELEEKLTGEEIIKKLSGGDMTQGSCASLALAYIGNQQGLDVTDFQGGKSRDTFSRFNVWERAIRTADSDVTFRLVKNEAKDTAALLRELPKDREYVLSAGKHASIVRNSEEFGLQFLELQSAKLSGWTPFDQTIEFYGLTQHLTVEDTLKERFGCRKSVKRLAGDVVETPIALAPVDSFKKTEEFKEILGYINTDPDKQQKGAKGGIK